jgi:hypothetical protein
VLLSRIPFPQEVVKFDDMTMRGDHIFFVDPFDQACFYEYAVVYQDDYGAALKSFAAKHFPA